MERGKFGCCFHDPPPTNLNTEFLKYGILLKRKKRGAKKVQQQISSQDMIIILF